MRGQEDLTKEGVSGRKYQKGRIDFIKLVLMRAACHRQRDSAGGQEDLTEEGVSTGAALPPFTCLVPPQVRGPG